MSIPTKLVAAVAMLKFIPVSVKIFAIYVSPPIKFAYDEKQSNMEEPLRVFCTKQSLGESVRGSTWRCGNISWS